MRARNKSLWILRVAVVAVALVAAAGCGSPSEEESEAEEHQGEEAVQLAFARCVRAEGIPDVPDPKPDQRGLGFARPPAGTVEEEVVDEANETCRKKLADELGELSESEDTETQDLVLAYVRCMREEGIDMPDPDFSESRSGPGVYIQRYADFGDPEFEEADDACREEVYAGTEHDRPGKDAGERGPGGDEKAPEQSGEPGKRPPEQDAEQRFEEEEEEEGSGS